MLKQFNRERVSLLLGIHPNWWFVHKYIEAFSGSHHFCPQVSSFWLGEVLCSVFRNIVPQCTVLTKHPPLFLIFGQTYLWPRKNFSREEVSLVPPDTPIPPPVFTFWVRQRRWYVYRERVTGLGLWELSGKWAMESLRDGSSTVLFSCWIVMTCLLFYLLY